MKRELPHKHYENIATIISEIFASLIFVCLNFFVIYCSQFQEAVKIHFSKNCLQLNFLVFNFRGFLQR